MDATNQTDGAGDTESIIGTTTFETAIWALVAPFIIIPTSIIFARLVKYAWKVYQAKKYGYDDDIFEDPLAELGLKIRRGYENTAEIRKIRKEQRKFKAEIEQRAKLNEMTILESEAQNQSKQGIASAVTDSFQKRFMSAFPQLRTAETYIATIRRQTRRTWIDRFSPDAMRRWINISRYARAWMVFQVFFTILAIINYVMLTYLVQKDDRNERKLVKTLDIVYALVFLLDYALSFYTAEDRLRFYFNYMSLIDLLSIISPFVFVLVASESKFVWFVGLIRIFRATRILRTYRILAFAQSEETRELTTFILTFCNFVFFSASIINATESLIIESRAPATLLNWHDSLYYIMVTFSTIGFGDLTPSSTISRIIVMFLIILVITYVPYQTGKIIELYNSLSRYQRARHTPSSNYPHAIVGGNVTPSDIIEFCREYFIADPTGSVVIVHTEEPTLEIRRLLNHPFYRSRIEYLRGNLVSIPDLRRAAAQYATAMFLLNASGSGSYAADETLDEASELKSTRGADAQVLMQALVAKNEYPGLPIFAQVRDVRSKDLSPHCGCDRILCIDEVKMSLLAANCLVPGLQTLILNLVHTYKELETSSIGEFWMREYQHGVANQLYSFKVPNGLAGMRFYDAVREVYESYGVIIFALMTSNAGFNQNPVRICFEPGYRIKNDDIAFCISDGGDETILRIVFHFKNTYKKADLERMELEMEMNEVVGNKSTSPFSIKKEGKSLNDVHNSNFEEVNIESGQIGTVPDGISNHVILCGHVTARAVRQFVVSIRGKGDSGAALTIKPNQNATQAVARRLPIVCLTETLPKVEDLGTWAEILSNVNVHVLQGTPIKKTCLIQAGIATCSRIVILAKPDKHDGGSSEGQSQNIPDSNSLFVIKMLQREWPKVRFLVELHDGSNVKYFSTRNIEWNTDNLRMQSILSNYALNTSDRIALYRKVRAEDAEQSSIWFQLIRFVFGPSDEPSSGKDTKIPVDGLSSPTGAKKSRSHNHLSKRSYTPSGAIKQATVQGDYDALENFTQEGGEEQHPAAATHPQTVPTNNTGFSQVHTEEDAGDMASEANESDVGDKEVNSREVPITEAYLRQLLEEAELNESGLSPYPVYHFDRHFAAGMVSTSSLMHSLLCQTYMRPYIVDIVRALIQNIVHLPVIASCAGRKYIDVVHCYVRAGYVPIGLYRRGATVLEQDGGRSPTGSPTEGFNGLGENDTMPYVYTNCHPGDIVSAGDLIFAIRKYDSSDE